MANKAQFAYTQYVKVALEKVRALKEQGHDVSECNRLLQSIVASVIEGDYNCADFLINELEVCMQKIESLRPIADFNAISARKAGFPKIENRFMAVVSEGKPLEEEFKVKIKKPPAFNNEPETAPRFLLNMLYVFLVIFVLSIITVISFVISTTSK